MKTKITNDGVGLSIAIGRIRILNEKITLFLLEVFSVFLLLLFCFLFRIAKLQ